MRWLRRLPLIVLFVGAVYVSVRLPAVNGTPVRVDYLLGSFEGLPLWQALIGAFGLGALLVGLLSLLPITRARMVARRYRKATRRLESEIQELRNLPLGPGPSGNGEDQELVQPPDRPPLERGV